MIGTAHRGRGPDADPIEVTLVTSEGCHFCQRAHEILDTARSQVTIDLREVSLDSEEGQALQSRWRPPFPPMLIVDGDLFGYGRISERKLMKFLTRRANGHGA